jgi:phage shock protein C
MVEKLIDQRRRLVRPIRGRRVAGVCLALANYFNISVTLVRIIFVFLLLPGGLPGFIPYVLAWLVIPSDDEV